jgi:tryptophanyl-tRNA synthetase
VSAHSELAWVFNCVARIGWMNRMTQFKEKAGSNKENASVGLLVYPNLMAADILIYKATHVPVGEDQKQHLELTRDIAKKFNNDFKCGEYFPSVKPLISKETSRVMSLRDGKKKMSKSEDSDQSRINLKDDKDSINQKIKKARTDNEPIPSEINGLKNRNEAANLISIYASINRIEVTQVLKEFGGKDFSTFKSKLSESLVEKVCPIGNEIKKLLKDKSYLNEILQKGAKRADFIAKNNIKEIYDIIGLTKFT